MCVSFILKFYMSGFEPGTGGFSSKRRGVLILKFGLINFQCSLQTADWFEVVMGVRAGLRTGV